MHTVKLQITGMKCQHCVQNVSQALNNLAGISATVSLDQANAVIQSEREIDTDMLIKVIAAAGYQASVQN